MRRVEALAAAADLPKPIPGREVPCPKCHAPKGRACTGRWGDLHNLHASRYEAAGLPTALTRREPE